MPPPNQTQAEIAQLILGLDRQRTVEMRQQLELSEAMRKSQSGQTVDMAALETRLASLGSTAGGVGTSAERGAGRARGAYSGLSADATSLESDLRDVGEGLANIGEKTAESWDNLGNVFHQLIPTDLRTQLEGIQQTFGGLTGPGGVFGSANVQASKFRDVSMDIQEGLIETKGAFADAFGMLPRRALGDTQTVLAEFNEYISGPSGMINGLTISRVATAEMAMEARGLAKSMNFSAQEMQSFMTRQISLTGEAGNDMAREAAVYSQRLARATGDSAKFISQNLIKIIDDTERFGNVTVDEAARISVTLRQLGVGYEELGGMVGKYMSFESAAQSVSALTTVFGVQLDAMEMMQLANEDQEQFLFRMREQFIATGKSVDDMTLAEKRLVREQLGLSSIEAVERLFDPTRTISSMEELSAVTDEGIGGTQEVMAELAENIIDLQSATEYSADAMMDIMRERMLLPSRELAIEMEENYTRMGASFERAVPEHVADAMTSFGSGITSMLSDTDMEQVASNLEGIADMVGNVDEAIDNWSQSGIGEKIESATATTSGVPSLFQTAMTGISAAATDISDAFNTAIDSIIDKLHEVGLLPVSSPNKVGRELGEGTGTAPAKIVEEAWGSAFTTVGTEAQKMISERGSAEAQSVAESVIRASAYQDTIEQQISAISSAERERFQEYDDISSTQLRDELANRESLYSAVAREAGEQKLLYEDLTETQKEEYAARLRLGHNYESELRQILSSEAYQEGASQTDNAQRIQGMLESYKESGTSFESFSEDFKKRLKDQYGITEDIYNSAMEGNSSISDIAVGAAESQAEAIRRRQAEQEGTEGEEDQTTTRNNSEANAATARYSRSMVEKQQQTNIKLDAVAKAIQDLQKAMEEKDMGGGGTEIVLDGKKIVDYIVRNPAGQNTSKTIVLK